jgi:LPXTG-motif cell wall-anchored protein
LFVYSTVAVDPRVKHKLIKNMTTKTMQYVPAVIMAIGFLLVASMFLAASSSAQVSPNTNTTSGTGLSGATPYNASNGLIYSIPPGYQAYNSSGIFYNSSTGMYYNPFTGQTSATAPTGPASTTATGAFNIPAGYNVSAYGTYYSPATGLYYDPATGFYSSSLPSGPTYFSASPSAGTPGLPNTGAGGDFAATLAILAIVAVLGFVGMRAWREKAYAQK